MDGPAVTVTPPHGAEAPPKAFVDGRRDAGGAPGLAAASPVVRSTSRLGSPVSGPEPPKAAAAKLPLAAASPPIAFVDGSPWTPPPLDEGGSLLLPLPPIL